MQGFLIVIGISFFTSLGYVAGVTSESRLNKSVLGVQTSGLISKRLAMMFNLERPTEQSNIFQLAPENPTPTLEPTPTDVDATPKMIWGGSRNSNPTSTPAPTDTPIPNNVIITPDDNKPDNSNPGEADTPTPNPTPKYKTNWGRNTPEPTPNNVIIEASAGASEGDSGQTHTKINVIPTEIQNLIDGSGLQMDNLQIVRQEGESGVHISGGAHEKLFGLIPVSYPITIQVDETNGAIQTASVPWWRTVLGNPFTGNITQVRCGDGICSPKENYINCPADCTPVCGNGICEYGEGSDTCSQDCTVSN